MLALQNLPLDSPEVMSLVNMEQEEEAPFPGARPILHWEQRIVSLANVHAAQDTVDNCFPCQVHSVYTQQNNAAC